MSSLKTNDKSSLAGTGGDSLYGLKDLYDMCDYGMDLKVPNESGPDQKAHGVVNGVDKQLVRGLGGRGKRVGGGGGRISIPPPLDVSTTFRKKYRFFCTSANARNVSVADLLGVAGTICTTANTGVTTMAACCKINKVTVWPSASASATTYADVEWIAAASGFDRERDVTINIPQGVTMTGALSFRPQAKSLSSFWLNSTIASTNIFFITCSVGSVVELDASYVLSAIYTPVNIAVATGTLGAVYYLAMDGPSTNTFQPTNLPSTH